MMEVESSMTFQGATVQVPTASGHRCIEFRPIKSLRPYPTNARTHSKHQIRQIANSISTFGFTTPVLHRRGRPDRGPGTAESKPPNCSEWTLCRLFASTP